RIAALIRSITACGIIRPHTTTLLSIHANNATNHCQCPARGHTATDQRVAGEDQEGEFNDWNDLNVINETVQSVQIIQTV
ncbi:MAG: hypothetical protein Q8S00_31275, partial [Deltaproteobacteria bacterium]|nr:hypothetical protein [Deltaproteobacteria bacterium]